MAPQGKACPISPSSVSRWQCTSMYHKERPTLPCCPVHHTPTHDIERPIYPVVYRNSTTWCSIRPRTKPSVPHQHLAPAILPMHGTAYAYVPTTSAPHSHALRTEIPPHGYVQLTTPPPKRAHRSLMLHDRSPAAQSVQSFRQLQP